MREEDGRLLLRKRTPREAKSIIPGKTVKGDWELLGGAVKKEKAFEIGNERVYIETLKREIEEEVGGIETEIPLMSAMYPTVFTKKYPDKEIKDSAFVIIIKNWKWIGKPKGEIMWVNPNELKRLAEKPKGQQLLSGWGKRMCRMALKSLSHSSVLEYQIQAKKMLTEIQKEL